MRTWFRTRRKERSLSVRVRIQKAQLGKPIEGKTDIYGGKAVENVVQALAALIIRWQMTEIYKNVGLRPTFQGMTSLFMWYLKS